MRPTTLYVRVCRIEDPNSPGTQHVASPSDADLQNTLNAVYKQAGIQFVVDAHPLPDPTNIVYDTSPKDGLFDGADDGGAEENAFTNVGPPLPNAGSWVGNVRVFFLNASYPGLGGSQNKTVGSDGGLSVYAFSQTIQSLQEDMGLIVCHELGHVLGLSVYPNFGDHDPGPWPFGTSSVMRPGPENSKTGGIAPGKLGRWLRFDDWKQSNKFAEKILNNSYNE